MWSLNREGEKVFKGGKEDWADAARVAQCCPYFTSDDEDEMMAEEPISCYNCRYRRWTQESFVCLHK